MHFVQSKMGLPENKDKVVIVTGAAVRPLVTISGIQAYLNFLEWYWSLSGCPSA
jgi:hypothetical protein